MSDTNKNYLIAALIIFSSMLFLVALYQKHIINSFTANLKNDIALLKLEKSSLELVGEPKLERTIQVKQSESEQPIN